MWTISQNGLKTEHQEEIVTMLVFKCRHDPPCLELNDIANGKFPFLEVGDGFIFRR